ncbi:MAG: HAD-IB family phosphatase [Candidatus Dojkabacteria bacterium]|jgi:HAD superfamily phosphoserine phosphatase-like hydrolase|nr:HAD-IB family phosphatase [Candidatus Dojkabacteria bacterium]
MDRKLALFDIDKTIFDGYIILHLASFQTELGIISQKINDNLQSIAKKYSNGLLPYEIAQRKINEYYAVGLKDLSYAVVVNSTNEFIKSNRDMFYPYVERLFYKLKNSYDIYLVTGEFEFIANACKENLSAYDFFASKCEIVNKKFSGRVEKHLAFGREKEKEVKSLIEKYTNKGSFAVGDSEGDIDMLKLVEHAFCINPTPQLEKEANRNSWVITNEEVIFNQIMRRLGS